jgi:hypothetical protein
MLSPRGKPLIIIIKGRALDGIPEADNLRICHRLFGPPRPKIQGDGGNNDYQSITSVTSQFCIQGVPGGKVNILGGHSIGHSKQKILYLTVNRKMFDKKEILPVRTVSNTGIYCSSDRVGTLFNKCSKISPPT